MPSKQPDAGLAAGDLLFAINPLAGSVADDALERLSAFLRCLDGVQLPASTEMLVTQCRQAGVVIDGLVQQPEALMWVACRPDRLTDVLSILLQSGFSAPLRCGTFR